MSKDTHKTQDGSLKTASSFESHTSSEAHYDEWAKQYEQDLVEKWGYVSPQITADAFQPLHPNKHIEIIEYGCGTGLIGQEYQKRGYHIIDGMDISEQMLAGARAKNCYRNIWHGDVTKGTDLQDNIYDAGMCVGSMGAGHVEAEYLTELLRPIKIGGILLIYMNEVFYQKDDFARRFALHAEQGHWQILRTETSNYMSELDRPGRMFIGKKLL